MAGSDWSSYVVGKLDTSIDVDSKVPHIRKTSEAKLTEELKYASHLGLPAVMVRITGRKTKSASKKSASKKSNLTRECVKSLCIKYCSKGHY